MKNIFSITFILILLSNCASAQLLTGTVKDAETNEALPYVNAGIVSKGIGTVINTDGVFKISLNNNDGDSLKVSMLGYRPQTFLVADLKKTSFSYKYCACAG